MGGEAEGVPELSRPENSETPDTMSAVTAFTPLLIRTPQDWIRGNLWHATRLSCRVPVGVLDDIGAGGNYSSQAFTKTFQNNLRGGKSIISSAGKEFLRADNTRNSGVSPMFLLLFHTFSVLVAYPEKLLYTVGHPSRGLLNRGKKKKKMSGIAPVPRPPPPTLLVQRK